MTWYERNKEKVKQQARKWALENPGRRREIVTRYARIHSEDEKARSRARYARDPKGETRRIGEIKKRRRESDPAYAIGLRLRCRLANAVATRRAPKTGNFIQLLGCSIPELIAYLESTFKPEMTWDNRRLWEIDHKKPVSSFDLSDPDQQRACFHFSNLQCLWRHENRAKASRLY